MKKETCSRTRGFGIPADTCGTKLRDKNWSRERRIEESDDEETREDGAHSNRGSDGARGWISFRTNEKRVVRFHECSQHWTGSGSRVCTRGEVRRGVVSVLHARVG